VSQGSTEDLLLRLSDLNYAESQREFARFSATHVIEESSGLLMTAAGTRFPAAPFNAVSLVGPQTLEPSQVLERAHGFFDPLDRGFAVMTKGHSDQALQSYCESQDLPHFGDSPGMLLEAAVAAPVLADGAEIKTVTSIEEAEQFIHVAAHAFEAVGLPVEVAQKLLCQPKAWLQPHWQVHMIVENGEAVAGAMVLMSHGIAGIYWVATLAEARGRGYGEAVTRSVSNAAFSNGASAVVLQASHFGEPVYRRIGFREITRYHWYLVAA
jgi:hypothetical protein